MGSSLKSWVALGFLGSDTNYDFHLKSKHFNQSTSALFLYWEALLMDYEIEQQLRAEIMLRLTNMTDNNGGFVYRRELLDFQIQGENPPHTISLNFVGACHDQNLDKLSL